MSANNEDHSEPNEENSKPLQNKPTPKRRSAAKTRRPSKTTASENRVSDAEKTNAPVNTADPDTSTQAETKQAARRPAKKKSDSNRVRENHSENDVESDKAPVEENQKSTGKSNSDGRNQPAKRPAKRKSESNRRRSGSSSRSSSRGGRSNRGRPTLRQPPVNPEELQAKAWELYRADINEESTAMFNEEEAADLVRRSFILADIFLRFRDELFDTETTGGKRSAEPTEKKPEE